MKELTNRQTRTKKSVMIGMLGAMAFIFMFFEFPLPPFPAYLKMDASELPVILATLMYGPLAGVATEFIKVSLNFLLKSSTGGIGELANFLVGSAYIIPIGIMTRKKVCSGKISLGALFGVISMVVVAVLANYFILIPIYMGGITTEALRELIILTIIPFNLVKGFLLMILTIILFKGFKGFFNSLC